MIQCNLAFLRLQAYVLWVSLGFVVTPVAFGAEKVICPDTLVVDQHLAQPPSPWEALLADVPHHLMSVAFFDGHPKEKAALVPDAEARRTRRQIATWRLARGNPRGYWIACAYHRTSIMLIRRLDPTLSQCAVTYDAQVTIGGHSSVHEVRCK